MIQVAIKEIIVRLIQVVHKFINSFNNDFNGPFNKSRFLFIVTGNAFLY